MSCEALASLDLGRYQRWFDGAVGCNAAMLVFGSDGNLIWGGNGQTCANFGFIADGRKDTSVGCAAPSRARPAVVGCFVRVIEAVRAVAQDEHIGGKIVR